jgi:hypothetical protein
MSIQYHVSHVRDSEGINHGSSDFGIRAQALTYEWIFSIGSRK